MRYSLDSVLVLLFGLLGLAYASEFCHRGFQIAAKYHECWESATYANRFTELYEKHERYTPEFLQAYATHMCSVVKPKALECLRKQVAECSNAQKLISMADESGGACEKNGLNPAFKHHIIDHLKTVKGDSPCFTIADDSYKCYVKAGEQIMKSGVDTVDISKFYKVADKFFDIIWDCLITIFRSNSDICEQWQLPMLLALQKTAMPSLFGMRLNNNQIAKLELEDARNIPEQTTTTSPDENECGQKNDKYFILLKALIQKPQPEPGDLVLQVNTGAGDNGQPLISIVNTAQDNQDVYNFVDIISDKKEKKKKEKEIKTFIQRIGNAQKKAKQEKKGQQPKQNKKGTTTPVSGPATTVS
ncbi:uncharacterized protein LOC106071093 [Biomphalaria glabrata]|uniref:Uncharacterized protein LOC106071093 n=1 Tax=Biomphalaria glabrata TaxID=6526 RepID=A0A9W3AU94_BIOGL|nr:uncharacterized protein LOC106071093 [Biomphalaria glabrata]